jgi:mevalonate kinase
MITCSAPGKVYLFGEHAVVYGEPAIACAINLRVSTSVELESSGRIRIDALNRHRDCPNEEVKYACCAAHVMRRFFGIDFGAKISIKSQLPPRQGLGSSAAVSVSAIKALAECLDIALNDEEVAKLGHQVESAVQGRASPADTYVSSTGGVVLIEQTQASHLSPLNIPLIIGATGTERLTSDVIAAVAKIRERYPAPVEDVLSAIGNITRLGKQKLAEEDFVGLGELMNINHGLLESIGVSDKALSQLVYAARAAGALGAKITGAGRGGCIIAIANDGNIAEISRAVKKNDAQVLNAAFSDSGLHIDEARHD